MRTLMLITVSLLLLGAVAVPAEAAPPSGTACHVTHEPVYYSIGPLDGHIDVPNGIECYY